MKRDARLVPLALAGAIVSISFAAIFFRLAAPTHPMIVAGTRSPSPRRCSVHS